MPKAAEFALSSTQATLFTPEADVSPSRFISQLLSRWAARFDAEPTVIPLPEGVPKEIPKILLQSHDRAWRCEVASGRLNIFWRQTKSVGPSISLSEFYQSTLTMLADYTSFVSSPVRRIAAVTNRYARTDDPGIYLARHFCQERWLAAPLNRPENFELHAHKQFELSDGIMVNSWCRNKTGKLADTNEPIVLVEQDLNTSGDDLSHDFSESEMRRFFENASNEFDKILELYYPKDSD